VSRNIEKGNGKNVDYSSAASVAGTSSLQPATAPVARPERWTLDEIMRQQPANASLRVKKSQFAGLQRWLSTNHNMSFETFANLPRQELKTRLVQFGEEHVANHIRAALRKVDLLD